MDSDPAARRGRRVVCGAGVEFSLLIRDCRVQRVLDSVNLREGAHGIRRRLRCGFKSFQKLCAGHFDGAELVVEREHIVDVKQLDLACFDRCPDRSAVQYHCVRS